MKGFAITAQTRSSAELPIQPSEANPFKQVRLSEVAFEAVVTKKGDVRPALKFTFNEASTGRKFTHIEWGIGFGSKDEENRQERLNSRVKHIYEAFATFPEAGIGVFDFGAALEGKTEIESSEDQDKVYSAFFQALANDFAVESVAKVWKNQDAWILLTYDTNDDVAFPMLPNFIELYRKGTLPTNLQVNKKYHTFVQKGGKARGAGNPANPAAGSGGGAPSMDDLP